MDVGVDHRFGGAPAGRRDQPAVSKINPALATKP